jgi:hypothetical protein
VHARLPVLLVLLTALAAGGCAGRACSRVKADRREFLARRGGGEAAQLVVAIPTATLSQSLSWPLSQLPPVAVPVPDLGPLDLGVGPLEIGLRSVAVLPAPEGRLGLRVRFALMSRGAVVLALDLDAVVAPQVAPQGGSVRIVLRAQDLQSLRPSLPPEERRKFADFVLARLPAGAERLVSRAQVERFADEALGELVARSFPRVRDDLLARAGPLVDVEVELPPVPVSRVVLRSSAADLELWVHTTLPAAGLAAGPARAAGGDARLVQVRMSGGAAAELANQAIARGQIPARWTAEGEPSPGGEFEAGVGWVAGPRPLRLHAWKQQEVCAEVVFSGTPRVQVAGGEVQLDVADGRIERVTGAVKARAAVWFSGLGRRTFAFSQAVAGATEFDLLGTPYRATPVAARVVGDDVAIDLQLAEARPAAPSRARRP